MATFRERVMGGDFIAGILVFEFMTPGIARLMQLAGCEFILYDMEHTGITFETLRRQTASCDGLDIVPLARVPRGEYHFLARALDVGVKGVMVPMVETADQAAEIAAATRYPPAGRRGAAFGFPHDDYEAGSPVGKVAKANSETLVIAQIETEHGLANVDAIAATDGIDALWVGHFDLTNFLGIPGEFDNPVFTDALDTVAAAARRHGKGAAFMPSDAKGAAEVRGRGYNLIGVGTDHGLLVQAVSELMGGVRRA